MKKLLLGVSVLLMPFFFGWYVMMSKDFSKNGRLIVGIWTITCFLVMLTTEDLEPFLVMNAMGFVGGLLLINFGSKSSIDSAIKESELLINVIQTTGSIPGIDIPEISLEKGETGIRKKENSKLWIIKTKRSGTMVGTRIGKIYIGTSQGNSREVFEEVSSGIAYLTTKRIIFIGDYRSLNIRLTDALSVNCSPDSIVLHLKNKDKPIEILVNNGIIWRTLIELMPTAIEQKSSIKSEIDNNDESSAIPTAFGNAYQTRKTIIPEHDNWEQQQSTLGDRQPINAHLFIEYVDGQGAYSAREIDVTFISPYEDGGLLIEAFCRVRQSRRTFLTSRIKHAFDVETGEVIDDPVAWLLCWYEKSSHARTIKAFNYSKIGVLALVFIARLSGSMREPQRNVIAAYITAMSAKNQHLISDDALTLHEIIRNVDATVADFRMAKREIKNVSAREKTLLYQCGIRLVHARKTPLPMQVAALEELREALGIQPSKEPIAN